MKRSIGNLEVADVIIEGKTKIVYDIPESKDLCLVFSKDKITAGDGAKSHDLEGKATISNSTAASIFELLTFAGKKNYFEIFIYIFKRYKKSFCSKTHRK